MKLGKLMNIIEKYAENSFQGTEGKNQHLKHNCEESHRG